MSNFICEKCGALIVEKQGFHVSECPHYPMSGIERERISEITETHINYMRDNSTKEDLTNE
jgi:hypothetical protein